MSAPFDFEGIFGVEDDIFESEEDRRAAQMESQEEDTSANLPSAQRRAHQEEEADHDNYDHVYDSETLI